MTFPKPKNVDRAKEYREPVLSWGAHNVQVSFFAFDPATGQLKRKRVKLNRELKGIKGKRAQREYAEGVRQRLRDELHGGWNPWMKQEDDLVYATWEDTCSRYKEHLAKQLSEHNMREESVASYLSYQRVLMRWVEGERRVVRYAYQFDKRLVDDFLDYVFLDKGNTIRTRNNYLAWLKSFSRWMMQKSLIGSDPTSQIANMRIKAKGKNRDVIPDEVLKRMHDWLTLHNRHFLLACQLLHYVFVRPHELARIKVGDFSLSDKTLRIHWDVAKNWQEAVVTLPLHVVRLMIELRVFDSPGDWYLFSEGFCPGADFRNEKAFRDYWARVLRKELGFSDRYKFYSLKDTGITNMLRSNTDLLSVRDQARHSSILITDMYTPKDVKKANRLLLGYKGVL